MKRIFVVLLILVSTTAFAQDKKPRVGILQFTAKGLGDVEAEIIGEIFQSEIVSSGKFDVLDRANMNAILDEQEFQTTGCTESSCAVEIGKLLNMEYMFYGSAMKLGESYIISVGMVNIETSQITHSERVSFSVIDEAEIKVVTMAKTFGGGGTLAEKAETAVEIESTADSHIKSRKIAKVVLMATSLSLGASAGAFHIQSVLDMTNKYQAYMDLVPDGYSDTEWQSVIYNAWSDYELSVESARKKILYAYISYGASAAMLITSLIIPTKIKNVSVSVIPDILEEKTYAILTVKY